MSEVLHVMLVYTHTTVLHLVSCLYGVLGIYIALIDVSKYVLQEYAYLKMYQGLFSRSKMYN